MLRSVIEGPFRTKPKERAGYETYRHLNGRWYQRRMMNRGNEKQQSDNSKSRRRTWRKPTKT